MFRLSLFGWSPMVSKWLRCFCCCWSHSSEDAQKIKSDAVGRIQLRGSCRPSSFSLPPRRYSTIRIPQVNEAIEGLVVVVEFPSLFVLFTSSFNMIIPKIGEEKNVYVLFIEQTLKPMAGRRVSRSLGDSLPSPCTMYRVARAKEKPQAIWFRLYILAPFFLPETCVYLL